MVQLRAVHAGRILPGDRHRQLDAYDSGSVARRITDGRHQGGHDYIQQARFKMRTIRRTGRPALSDRHSRMPQGR